MTSYLTATRHPWVCFLFVLPLLATYEGGIHYLSGTDPHALRNGADVWLRWGLQRYGIQSIWAAPALVMGLLLIRTWAMWATRPKDPFTALFGMAIESVLFAAGLWIVARNIEPFLQQWSAPAVNVVFHTPAVGQVITYVGAGVYEEVLFRLGLYSVMYFFLRIVLVPRFAAVGLAAVAASVMFAAAHHIGPNGEEMNAVRFGFRLLAGLYFTVLYVARGFGVAVGAHAGYDILVGVSVG